MTAFWAVVPIGLVFLTVALWGMYRIGFHAGREVQYDDGERDRLHALRDLPPIGWRRPWTEEERREAARGRAEYP